MSALDAYLRSLATKRRELGRHDCVTLPCDWAVARGFPDPMAAWRGAYATAEEADELIAQAGGLAPLFEKGFTSAGIPLNSGPVGRGDVGVLAVHGEECGSIFTGERWSFVGARGIGFALVDSHCIIATWALGDG